MNDTVTITLTRDQAAALTDAWSTGEYYTSNSLQMLTVGLNQIGLCDKAIEKIRESLEVNHG